MIDLRADRRARGARRDGARLGREGGPAADPRPRPRAPLRPRLPAAAWPSLQLLGICIPEEYGGAGMDYISLGLACEELEYVDTHLRVIMSVHVGLNCMTLLVLGHRGAEAEVPGAAGEGREDRDLRPDRAERRLRRGRASRRRPCKQGRPLRPERREDVDQPGRRGRPLPGHRLDRPGEEEEARPQRAVRLHRRARLQGLQLLHDEGEVGDPRRQHRRLLDGGRRGAGREPAWARRARASRSRCSRSRTAATRWPPGATGLDPRLPRRLRGATRRSARPSAWRSASTSS